MTCRLQRTNQADLEFIALVQQLNQEQEARNGDKNDYYMQFNQLDEIDYVVIAYINEQAVACGGLRPYDSQQIEVKRMFTSENYRQQGIAGQVLIELEQWARELGYEKCILETGTMNPEAVEFYHKNEFKQVAAFPPYTEDIDSICFEKKLK